MKLPEPFLTRMRQMLGDEYEAFLNSYDQPAARGLRLNLLKADPDLELPFPTAPVEWCPTGRRYDGELRPGLHPWHDAGVYYIQEPSAMAVAEIAAPRPGERVLDLCAAPGGKTSHLASLAGDGCLLISNEIHPQRARILSRNVERMGIRNAAVLNESPNRLAERFPGFFDCIVVDAPCSGEGMFRKEEAAVTDWSQQTVEMCAARQAEILDNAARLLKPGGRLVYSTCTFAPEENEQTVATFLDRHPEFAPERVDAPWFTPGEQGTYRMWPHKLLGEGHFGAVLRKLDGEEGDIPEEKGTAMPKPWQSFAKEMGLPLPEGIFLGFGDRLYLAPQGCPELKGLRVLRPGLELGELKKDRLEPAHALALWAKPLERTMDLPSEGPEIGLYLHGEVLPCTEKGWCLVTVDGYSIGWGKGDGRQLKNHYPKGLRR